MELNNNEILIALGLASIESEDATEVIRLFHRLLQLRTGSRIGLVLGAGWMEIIEELRKRQSAEADLEARELLDKALPDHQQYLMEEMRRTIDEFVTRLDVEIAGRAGSV